MYIYTNSKRRLKCILLQCVVISFVSSNSGVMTERTYVRLQTRGVLKNTESVYVYRDTCLYNQQLSREYLRQMINSSKDQIWSLYTYEDYVDTVSLLISLT